MSVSTEVVAARTAEEESFLVELLRRRIADAERERDFYHACLDVAEARRRQLVAVVAGAVQAARVLTTFAEEVDAKMLAAVAAVEALLEREVERTAAARVFPLQRSVLGLEAELAVATLALEEERELDLLVRYSVSRYAAIWSSGLRREAGARIVAAETAAEQRFADRGVVQVEGVLLRQAEALREAVGSATEHAAEVAALQRELTSLSEMLVALTAQKSQEAADARTAAHAAPLEAATVKGWVDDLLRHQNEMQDVEFVPAVSRAMATLRELHERLLATVRVEEVAAPTQVAVPDDAPRSAELRSISSYPPSPSALPSQSCTPPVQQLP